MDSFKISLLFLVVVGFTTGFHTGAPDQACDTMIPGHGVPAQTGRSPYRVMMQKTETNGEPLEIVLTSSTSGPPFKGFFIEIRQKGGDSPVGQFNPSSDPSVAQPVTCSGKTNVAMTHKNNDLKTQIKLQWTPPAGGDGEYEPLVTFVQQQDTFWVKEKADKMITVKSGGPSREGSASSGTKGNATSSNETSQQGAATGVIPIFSALVLTTIIATVARLYF